MNTHKDVEVRLAVKKQLDALVLSGIRIGTIAEKLGVSRQSVHLYRNAAVTASPKVLYNACKEFNIEFEIGDRKFGLRDFAPAAESLESVPLQYSLFDALNTLTDRSMQVEIIRKQPTELELKVHIRFAG